MYNLNLKIMSKKQIFWLIVVLVVVASIVFVKVVPVWSSLVGVVSFVAGCMVTWRVKILYDKYIKGK